MAKRQTPHLWTKLDDRMVRFMSRYGIELVRVALAVVFIWFGALKVAGESPVEELIARTVYWIVPPEQFVPFLGAWEIIVGLGLLFRVAQPAAADHRGRVRHQEPRAHRRRPGGRLHRQAHRGLTNRAVPATIGHLRAPRRLYLISDIYLISHYRRLADGSIGS
jgi:hypothetical protein